MKPEFKQFEQKFMYVPKPLYPSEIHTLPPQKLSYIGDQASTLIKSMGDKTMYQYTSEDLVGYMNAGLALPVVDSPEACNLVSFVKALPWFPGNPQPSESKALELLAKGQMPTGFESGSLIVPPQFQGTHLAADVKLAFASQMKDSFPGIPLFAVVVDTNTKSMQNNKDRGWVPITHEQSVKLLKTDVLKGWDHKSTIFVEPSTINWAELS